MPTLSELKRENAKLRARAEVQRDFNKADIERKSLIKENDMLRNPKKYAHREIVKKFGASLGAMVNKTGRSILSSQKSKKRITKTKKRAIYNKTKPIRSIEPSFSIRDFL